MDDFTEFHSTLDRDSKKDFTRDDFSSRNGYILGKFLVSDREGSNKLSEGKCDVRTNEVIIQDVSYNNDSIEVMAHVQYTFHYGDADADQEPCSAGYFQKSIRRLRNIR